MSAAILIIAFVAFFARLFIAARAMKSWAVAIALVVLGISVYAVPIAIGLRLDAVAIAAQSAMGFGFLILLDAVMLALGFGVPALLHTTEDRRRRGRHALFVGSVVLVAFAIDVWRVVSGFGLAFSIAAPELWFAIGIAAFLVVRLRFFEDD